MFLATFTIHCVLFFSLASSQIQTTATATICNTKSCRIILVIPKIIGLGSGKSAGRENVPDQLVNQMYERIPFLYGVRE